MGSRSLWGGQKPTFKSWFSFHHVGSKDTGCWDKDSYSSGWTQIHYAAEDDFETLDPSSTSQVLGLHVSNMRCGSQPKFKACLLLSLTLPWILICLQFLNLSKWVSFSTIPYNINKIKEKSYFLQLSTKNIKTYSIIYINKWLNLFVFIF